MNNKASFAKNLTILSYGLIVFGILLFCVTACSNSTTDVMSSYDEKFPVKKDASSDDYKPGIGEEGFEESKMLEDEYFKSSDGTLQLRAPGNAAFYKWELYLQTPVEYDGAIEYEKTLMTLPAICFQNGSSATTEYYIVYIPFSGLNPGSYVISLTATSKGGQKYTDKAALIIYDAIRYDN